MVSKGYTESQARVEQGKCRILTGSIERDAAGVYYRQELYSAIDEYVALDGGNAFFINAEGYKEYSVFTTMSCDLSNYANRD